MLDLIAEYRRRLDITDEAPSRDSYNSAIQMLLDEHRHRTIERLSGSHRSFSEHYGHTGTTYRPSQATAPTMPDAGANAKALNGLNVDVPEHLSCKLSLEIMTNPVRFVGEGITNNDCFEYAWIIAHLNKDKKHPITRQPVSEKMLVSDLRIKRECDEFTKIEQEAIKKLKI